MCLGLECAICFACCTACFLGYYQAISKEYNNAAVADSPTSPAIISQPGYEIPGHPTGPGFQSDPYEIRYGPSQHFQVPMRDYPRDPPPPYSPPPPAPTFPQQHTKY